MNTSTRVAIVILAVALSISTIFNAVQYFQAHPISLEPKIAVTPAPLNRVLINGTITINPNDAYYIEFQIPEGPITQVLVSGNFTVLDDSNIRVFIFNSSQSWNPLSTNFGALYDSELAISGTLNLTLRSGGDYYLVFNNYNSLYSTPTPGKTVNSQVTLSGYVS